MQTASDPLRGARIVSASADAVLATWLDVCIVIWRRDTLVPDVKAASDMLEAMAAKEPRGVGFVQFVDDGALGPSLAARTALAALLKRGAAYVRCSTIVFNGDGFRAAAVRALVTGVAWLARPGFPHEVFAGSLPAARLQSKHFAPKGSEESWAKLLVEVIDRIRAVDGTKRVMTPPPRSIAPSSKR